MADILKQYKKVKNIIGEREDIELSDEDVLRYQDVLSLLEERGYIHDIRADGANWYVKIADFDGFEEWLKEEIKESKRVSRREWLIGIVCAVIGAAIGLIPYIATLLNQAN